MPRFGPIHRHDFIACLTRHGFDGPFQGRNHEFMIKGEIRLILPNPHEGDISRDLLSRLLRQAGIGKSDGEAL
jgi:hypothetical protein